MFNRYLNTFGLLAMLSYGVLFLSGCPVPCETEPVYHDLPATTRSFVPYNNIQSFEMRHSAGAVTTFTFAGMEVDYNEDYICAECCTEDFLEYIFWTFSGDSPSMTMGVSLALEWNPDETTDLASLGLGINSDLGMRFALHADSTDPLNPETYTILDTASIQGVAYNNVYLISKNFGPSSIFMDSLWYQKDHGILKFSMNNGEYWELQP